MVALTDDHWLAELNLNLLATVCFDHLLIPQMIERGSGAEMHVTSLPSIHSQSGAAHLFIDNSADGEIQCMSYASGEAVASLDYASHDGYCYSWHLAGCIPALA